MGYILKIGDNVPVIGKSILANRNTISFSSVPILTATTPRGIAGIPNDKYYVCDLVNNAIKVFDFATDTLQKTISGYFNQPFDIEIDLVNNRYYVCNYAGASIRIMDLITDLSIANIGVGGATSGVCVLPNDRYYVAGPTYFKIYDYATNLQLGSNITTTSQPKGIAFDPIKKRYYVSSYGSNNVQIYDYYTNALITTTPYIYVPVYIELDIPNNRYYVTSNGGTLTIVNYTTNAIISTLNIPSFGIYINHSNGLLYCCDSSNTISKISYIYIHKK